MILKPGKIAASTATRLLLFGATGDLSLRMLLPSLYGLHRDRLIDPDFQIVGSARAQLDDAAFRAIAHDALKKFLPPESLILCEVDAFLRRISYLPLDISGACGTSRLTSVAAKADGQTTAIFLSVPPSLYAASIGNLKAAGLAGDNARIALEKPLGHDLHSSQTINDTVSAAFPEERTFRIDHYLGKETVQNLIALRFGNILFEPLWHADCVDHVQITVAETLGLEGRDSFYDGVGALRDMVQNHMLQLLALVAMEAPACFDAAAVRDEKVKVLRSLRPIDRTTVQSHSVIGQYTSGTVGGAAVPGYAEERGRASQTETFVVLKAHVDNWRWKGVPFYLRTGKRLPVRQSEIRVQFKPVPHSIFGGPGGTLKPNKLIIRLQPEEYIRLLVMVKEPGLDSSSVTLREVPLDLSLTEAFANQRRRIAYERLLLDFIQGDPTLFVRRDEVEAQWRWIDLIRDGWSHHGMTPQPYAAGTWGPPAAFALTKRDKVDWHG